MPRRDLGLLDAAQKAADRVDQLIDRSDRSARPLMHAAQLRRSVQAVSANIGEGFGRRSGPDRAYGLEIARGAKPRKPSRTCVQTLARIA